MTSTLTSSMPGNVTRQIRERRRQRRRFVEARDLDDQFLHAIHATSFSITPSQVTCARPLVAGVSHRRGAPAIGGEAVDRRRPGPRGSGAHTHPLTPSMTNSFGPPESIGSHDRLLRQERLERDVAEILVERRIDDRERVSVQLDEAIVVDRAEEVDSIRRPASAAIRSISARCVPSPATTRRSGRSTVRHRRHDRDRRA